MAGGHLNTSWLVNQRLEVEPTEFGILDHVFVGGGIKWNVYVRIVPNQSGSTTTWTFVRPDGLSDEDFESQLKGYDSEIAGWTRVLNQG
jgi:hypothetical protein